MWDVNAFCDFGSLHPRRRPKQKDNCTNLGTLMSPELRSENSKAPNSPNPPLSHLAHFIISLAFRVSIPLTTVMTWIVMSSILAYGWILWPLLRDVVHLLEKVEVSESELETFRAA
jgi:hypothetical protein